MTIPETLVVPFFYRGDDSRPMRIVVTGDNDATVEEREGSDALGCERWRTVDMEADVEGLDRPDCYPHEWAGMVACALAHYHRERLPSGDAPPDTTREQLLIAELRRAYGTSLGELVGGAWFVCARCREQVPASRGSSDPEGLCDGCWCECEWWLEAGGDAPPPEQTIRAMVREHGCTQVEEWVRGVHPASDAQCEPTEGLAGGRDREWWTETVWLVAEAFGADRDALCCAKVVRHMNRRELGTRCAHGVSASALDKMRERYHEQRRLVAEAREAACDDDPWVWSDDDSADTVESLGDRMVVRITGGHLRALIEASRPPAEGSPSDVLRLDNGDYVSLHKDIAAELNAGTITQLEALRRQASRPADAPANDWSVRYEGPTTGPTVELADGSTVEARHGNTFEVASRPPGDADRMRPDEDCGDDEQQPDLDDTLGELDFAGFDDAAHHLAKWWRPNEEHEPPDASLPFPGDPRPPAPPELEARVSEAVSQVRRGWVKSRPPGGSGPMVRLLADIDDLRDRADALHTGAHVESDGANAGPWRDAFDKLSKALDALGASEGAAPPVDPGAWTLSTFDSEPGQAGNVMVSRARWDMLVQAAADAGNEPGEDGHTADGFCSEVCNLLTFVDKGAPPPTPGAVQAHAELLHELDPEGWAPPRKRAPKLPAVVREILDWSPSVAGIGRRVALTLLVGTDGRRELQAWVDGLAAAPPPQPAGKFETVHIGVGRGVTVSQGNTVTEPSGVPDAPGWWWVRSARENAVDGWWPVELYVQDGLGPLGFTEQARGGFVSALQNYAWGGKVERCTPDADAGLAELLKLCDARLEQLWRALGREKGQRGTWGGAVKQAASYRREHDEGGDADAGLAGVIRDRDSAADGLARARAELEGLRKLLTETLSALDSHNASYHHDSRALTARCRAALEVQP